MSEEVHDSSEKIQEERIIGYFSLFNSKFLLL